MAIMCLRSHDGKATLLHCNAHACCINIPMRIHRPIGTWSNKHLMHGNYSFPSTLSRIIIIDLVFDYAQISENKTVALD
jgi:hypothetical protein